MSRATHTTRTPRRPRLVLLGIFAFGLALVVAGCTPEMKARAYASDDRDEWQQADRVIETLSLAPGHAVADLGAGGGYFTFLLADAVGPEGLVYAVDIDEGMNERLAGLAEEKGYQNVEVVGATPDDARLPAASVDLIFTSNTYHHIDDRITYFERVSASLRPGGRLAVLDYRDVGIMQALFAHSTDAAVIKDELLQSGYRLIGEHDFIEKQHFLIFERAN